MIRYVGRLDNYVNCIVPYMQEMFWLPLGGLHQGSVKIVYNYICVIEMMLQKCVYRVAYNTCRPIVCNVCLKIILWTTYPRNISSSAVGALLNL